SNAFSPTGHGNAAVAAGSVPKVSRDSRVETWLKGVTPTCPTQESSPTIDADNTPNEESDSEMFSVSQINLDQTSRSTEIKPLSAYIKEDGDADEGSSKKLKVKPKPTTEARGIKKSLSLKRKVKQEPITNFLGETNLSKLKLPTTVSSSSSGSNNAKIPDLKIPEPVVVLLNRGKESPLPPRSPGCSRVKKMKKDFNHPLKILRAANSKGGNSPVPVIEDGGSGDDQPCISLSAELKEIVNNLESEIPDFEKSVRSTESKESERMFQLTSPTRSHHQIGSGVSASRPKVKFHKLGSFNLKRPQIVLMPIYLKGPLERLHHPLLVDAQTQTSRQSSEYDVDMMDAGTAVFTQPLRRPDTVIPETASDDVRVEPGGSPFSMSHSLNSTSLSFLSIPGDLSSQELINPTPQKQTSFLSRTFTQSDDRSVQVCTTSV
ncbi:hypothetical protein FOCC_FOCC015654, partial [Frankliniella occidentalis]